MLALAEEKEGASLCLSHHRNNNVRWISRRLPTLMSRSRTCMARTQTELRHVAHPLEGGLLTEWRH